MPQEAVLILAPVLGLAAITLQTLAMLASRRSFKALEPGHGLSMREANRLYMPRRAKVMDRAGWVCMMGAFAMLGFLERGGEGEGGSLTASLVALGALAAVFLLITWAWRRHAHAPRAAD